MEQNDLEQSNITITGIEDKGWGISLVDEKGLKYNVSKYLKGTQNETKAFQVLKTLPGYGMGIKKCVKFATVPNSQGGQSRYVRIIGEVEAEQAQSLKTVQNTSYTPNLASGAIIQPTPPRQTNQSGEIRSNVALKMVSEILAAGVIPLDQWELWANNFYFYQPNKPMIKKLQEAGLTSEQKNEISLEDEVKNIPF